MSDNLSDLSLSIVFAGGGTAGHVNPLLSMAHAVQQTAPHAQITVIGTEAGLESRLVPQAGFPLKTIHKVPFPRRLNMDALRFIPRWKTEMSRVKSILKETHADVVVGVGGYVSAPVYKAAHELHIPIVIHEQNAKAGMANKLGSRWADFIGTTYDNSGLTAKKGLLRRVGLPLRDAIASTATLLEHDPQQARVDAARCLGLDPQRPILLVTGGSLGALSLNTAVSHACKELLEVTQVIHLCGNGKADAVAKTVSQLAGPHVLSTLSVSDNSSVQEGDYHLAEYLEHIELAFSCADLVICRSGAGTVNEISALGLPAIYVPLSFGNGEQRYNAEPVVHAGGGQLIADADFTAEWVKAHIPQLLQDHAQLEKMHEATWRYGIRSASAQMAKEIIHLGTEHYFLTQGAQQ